MLHDVLGLTPDAKGQADWLAESGYLAVAPDLYSGGGKIRWMWSTFRDLSAGSGPAFGVIEESRSFLMGHEGCSGRVGVIGFCMGGGFALLAAPSGLFQAASVNYGQVPDDVEEIIIGSCPIVGSFGARDRTMKGAAARLEGALASLQIEHDVFEYPDAGHSFMNKHEQLWFKLVGKVVGAGHDEHAAASARARIEQFFDEHLGERES